jgi:hypothetical protein
MLAWGPEEGTTPLVAASWQDVQGRRAVSCRRGMWPVPKNAASQTACEFE